MNLDLFYEKFGSDHKFNFPVGAVSGLFLIGYGVFRSFSEFFRQPDDGFMGQLTLGITMGQWLSLPMIAGGIFLLIQSSRAHHQ